MLSHFSRVQLCVTLWTAACQAPLSMGFSRKEYGMSCSFLLWGIFLIQGWNLHLLHLHLQAGSLPLAPPFKGYILVHSYTTGKASRVSFLQVIAKGSANVLRK